MVVEVGQLQCTKEQATVQGTDAVAAAAVANNSFAEAKVHNDSSDPFVQAVDALSAALAAFVSVEGVPKASKPLS